MAFRMNDITLTFINIGIAEVMLLIVAVPIIALGAYTIYQCLRNPELSSAQRIIWLIIILAVPTFKKTKRSN